MEQSNQSACAWGDHENSSLNSQDQNDPYHQLTRSTVCCCPPENRPACLFDIRFRIFMSLMKQSVLLTLSSPPVSSAPSSEAVLTSNRASAELKKREDQRVFVKRTQRRNTAVIQPARICWSSSSTSYNSTTSSSF